MALLTLGCLFLVGLVADVIGRLSIIPRVSLLLFGGLLIGPSGIGAISTETVAQWFPVLTHMALGMVGFLIGQSLSLAALRDHGTAALIISFSKALVSAFVVFLAAWFAQLPLALCAVLAGIATATAPAATYDVVHESGITGPFPDLLIRVVALDDVWGLILFSFLLSFAVAGPLSMQTGLLDGLVEVAGSIFLGVLLGLPMAYLTGRLVFAQREGEPILAEALGFVFLGVGAADVLGLSPILTCICMGAIVATLASHHRKPFSAIRGVEWPFMILFFLLAGASLEFGNLLGSGWLVLGYILARAVGILIGVQLGGQIAGIDSYTTRLLGFGLFPQAGVALGMSLMAAQRLPTHSQLILTIVLTSTVILELLSPTITKSALRRHQKHEAASRNAKS